MEPQMNMSKYFSAQDLLVLLDAPTNVTYPSGGLVRIDKAGIGGEGRTPVAAAADWCRKFSTMVTLPEGESEKDEPDTDLDDQPA